MTHRNNRFQRVFPVTAGKVAIAAAFLTGSIVAGSLAAADEPTTSELLEQIEKLQKQVEQVRDKQTAVDAEAESDAVGRVLDDAEKRSTAPRLFQGGTASGWEGRFGIRSDDGNFEFHPIGQMQFRGVVNGNNEGDDSFETWDVGIEMRRAKFGAEGHAFHPGIRYELVLSADRGGGVGLSTAFIEWMGQDNGGFLPDGMGFLFGQFKDLTFYEESVNAMRQLAAERSLVNAAIGGGDTRFIQGIGPIFRQDQFSATLLYTGGAMSANTPWEDMTWDYGIAARIDFFAMGNRTDARDFTAMGTEENLLRVGAGAHWSAVSNFRVLHHSFDVQFETDGGLGLFAAFYGRWMEQGDFDAYDMGFVVQVSQVFGDDWEVFARYGGIIFDNELALGPDTEDFFHEVTIGVNKYFSGHRLKATVDVNYLPNGNPGSFEGLGYQPNVGEFDDQVSLRGQLQFHL